MISDGALVALQLLGHEPHRPVDVVEERLEAGAQVVEAGIAVRRRDEPVLRAAAVARETHVALEAVLRQRVAFVEPELALLLGRDELEHRVLLDVAQLVARLHEVVARVEITGVLERQREPARLRVDAEPRWLSGPVGERDVEHLHVHLGDVVADPLLEHVDQETAVLLSADRPACDAISLLLIERPVAPRRPGDGSVL